MNIILIGNYEYSNTTSMYLYAQLLKNKLTTRGFRVKIIYPKIFFGKLLPNEYGIGKWLGYIDRYFLFR